MATTVRQRRLAAELRRIRADRGLTIQEVVAASNGRVQASDVSRWETGQRAVPERGLRALLDIYAVRGDERETILALALRATQRGWWQRRDVPEWFQMYVGFEAEASVVRTYSSELVHGLLQTPAYYRDFLESPPADTPDVERRVSIRLARQERITADDRPAYWAVLNEAVLARLVHCDHDMAREQLEHLLYLSALPGVSIHVLPFSAGMHRAMEGDFALLSFPETSGPDVAYLEYRVGSLLLEDQLEVTRYRRLFEHLLSQSLSPDASRQIIREAATSLG